MADGVRLGMMENPKEQLLSVAMRLWAKAVVGAALPGSLACASSLSLSLFHCSGRVKAMGCGHILKV